MKGYGSILYLTSALLTGALLGCTSAPPAVVCPPLRAYGTEFNLKLADEMDAAPDMAAWPMAVQDYIELRDQIRAACP